MKEHTKKQHRKRLCKYEGCTTELNPRQIKYCLPHANVMDKERHKESKKKFSNIPPAYLDVPETEFLQYRDFRDDLMTAYALSRTFSKNGSTESSRCMNVHRPVTSKTRKAAI